jgi:hypothetical protein
LFLLLVHTFQGPDFAAKRFKVDSAAQSAQNCAVSGQMIQRGNTGK